MVKDGGDDSGDWPWCDYSFAGVFWCVKRAQKIRKRANLQIHPRGYDAPPSAIGIFLATSASYNRETVSVAVGTIPLPILRPQTPLSYPSQNKTAQSDVTAETALKSALKITQ